MIVKIAIIRQYFVKTLIGISEVTALWAIALTIQPQSLVVAQPAIDVEGMSNSVTVEKIRIKGHTIFSEKEIEKITKPYRGQELDFNKLRNITKAITDLYISKGYITSGAFLPEQEIVDGAIDVRVIEGKLEDINIKGLKNLQESYVRSFISSAQDSAIISNDSENISDSNQSSPLNIKNIEEELDILKRNP